MAEGWRLGEPGATLYARVYVLAGMGRALAILVGLLLVVLGVAMVVGPTPTNLSYPFVVLGAVLLGSRCSLHGSSCCRPVPSWCPRGSRSCVHTRSTSPP